MELFNPEVQAEFERVSALVTDDPFASQHTLGLRDGVRAHFLIVDFFITEQRELGGIGPKDMKLLESALYRAWVSNLGASPSGLTLSIR